MATLYQINEEFERLEALLWETGGELTPEVEAEFDRVFADMSEARDDKLDGYVALIRELDVRAEVRRQEAVRLESLAEADERAVKRLKDRLKWFFESRGLSRVDTRRARISLVKNGGVRPLIWSEEFERRGVEVLPERFVKEVYTTMPDNQLIRQTLEDGEELPFARLGERGSSIRIK